jgi:glutathione S-transferase
MLKIYGVYRSRASRNIWLAHELGLPFQHVAVIQGYRVADPNAPDAPYNTNSPTFRKINAAGQIPSIVDGDFIMHESLAINLYLARKHGGPLAPATVAEEGLMAQWSLWAATSVETHALNVLFHRVSKPIAEQNHEIADAAIVALRAPFAVLDGALARSGHLVGDRFTVADLNVAEIIRYAMPATELFDAAPRVKAWLTACHARPAFKTMMAARDQEPA